MLSPLNTICPPSRAHLPLLDVLGVAGNECLTAFAVGLGLPLFFRRAADPLLAEPNSFYLVPLLGHNDMALGRMVRGALGFVESADARSFEQALFDFVAHFLLLFLEADIVWRLARLLLRGLPSL